MLRFGPARIVGKARLKAWHRSLSISSFRRNQYPRSAYCGRHLSDINLLHDSPAVKQCFVSLCTLLGSVYSTDSSCLTSTAHMDDSERRAAKRSRFDQKEPAPRTSRFDRRSRSPPPQRDRESTRERSPIRDRQTESPAKDARKPSADPAAAAGM